MMERGREGGEGVEGRLLIRRGGGGETEIRLRNGDRLEKCKVGVGGDESDRKRGGVRCT